MQGAYGNGLPRTVRTGQHSMQSCDCKESQAMAVQCWELTPPWLVAENFVQSTQDGGVSVNCADHMQFK